MDIDYDALATEVEEADGRIDSDLAERTAAAFHAAGPDRDLTAEHAASADALLHVIDAVIPGWSVHLHGHTIEPNGHWNCTLRKNDSHDNDEYIGRGKGPLPAPAILAATLRTMGYLHRTGRL